MDTLLVYDNSSFRATLRLLLECSGGAIRFQADDLPASLIGVLRPT
jgi:hypothetical protein